MKYNPININHPERWKEDTLLSVDFYNDWFLNFASKTFREARSRSIGEVEKALRLTDNLLTVDAQALQEHPEIFHILRLATAPPLAKARVEGLAKVPSSLVENLERGKLPLRMDDDTLADYLSRIAGMFVRLMDYDIFPWVERKEKPSRIERARAASVVGDRLCTTLADPIIRGEQERRQLASLSRLLNEKGYALISQNLPENPQDFPKGCYAFHYNVKVQIGGENTVNIPVDLAVKPKSALPGDLPLMVECKSAGDFTNTNKRRKEEAVKMSQLRNTYGQGITYVLFLCGYFDPGYLGYEAAEGIDWIWEHKANEFISLGL